jgi:2-polyprenyl-3-methyl-5-hydroxy-6-metoxy-1,4-benzoquinol methylase
VATVLEPEGEAHAGRFEGVYGGIYDRVIQTDAVRRLATVAYGDAGPVSDLDGFVKRVATGTHAVKGREPVLLDVPSGGGTMLPRLWRCGYRGRVLEADLGTAMLERAAQVAGEVPLDVALLRADAQDLPLVDGAVDAAVSLNGLHVMPDPRARVIRPRGRLWLVTLVSGGTRRADLVIRVGELTGILPGPPPTRATLLRWLGDAGFAAVAPLGGAGLLGIAATRR